MTDTTFGGFAYRSHSRHRRSLPMLLTLEAIGLATAVITFAAVFGAVRGWWPSAPRVSWSPPVLIVAALHSLLYVVVPLAEWRMWTARHERRVSGALGLFVGQQILATIWPVIFFAGWRPLGAAALWLTLALLLALDLLLAATTAAFWTTSWPSGLLLGLDFTFTLLITSLVVGSIAEHGYL